MRSPSLLVSFLAALSAVDARPRACKSKRPHNVDSYGNGDSARPSHSWTNGATPSYYDTHAWNNDGHEHNPGDGQRSKSWDVHPDPKGHSLTWAPSHGPTRAPASDHAVQSSQPANHAPGGTPSSIVSHHSDIEHPSDVPQVSSPALASHALSSSIERPVESQPAGRSSSQHTVSTLLNHVVSSSSAIMSRPAHSHSSATSSARGVHSQPSSTVSKPSSSSFSAHHSTMTSSISHGSSSVVSSSVSSASAVPSVVIPPMDTACPSGLFAIQELTRNEYLGTVRDFFFGDESVTFEVEDSADIVTADRFRFIRDAAGRCRLNPAANPGFLSGGSRPASFGPDPDGIFLRAYVPGTITDDSTLEIIITCEVGLTLSVKCTALDFTTGEPTDVNVLYLDGSDLRIGKETTAGDDGASLLAVLVGT